MCVCCVWLFVTQWRVALQAPLSMGFNRQEYWSVLPFYYSRGSSWPRDWIHVFCISCIGRFFTTEPPGKPEVNYMCLCLVAQSLPTLCKPMDCSTPGFPVFHSPLEFAQAHVHWVSDAIQPCIYFSWDRLPALWLFWLWWVVKGKDSTT